MVQVLLIVRYFVLVLVTEARTPSIGVCNTWNGIECGDQDTVDVGRGPGSCNSNLGCPCCAPFCSKEGYCQTTDVLSTLGIEY